MDDDLVQLYRRASSWTGEKVTAAAAELDAPTPCTGWRVRDLLNHMLETQRYFTSVASGTKGSPPGQTPPDLLDDDPVQQLAAARSEFIDSVSAEGAVERAMPMLGIALADQLLHGWDLARAIGQDATMPDGLAEAAYGAIHGRFTEDQRKGVFGPELPAADDASPQQRLLAYTGRAPE